MTPSAGKFPQYIIVYDDTCGLCQRSILFWKAYLKRPATVMYLGIYAPDASSVFHRFHISVEDAKQRMCIIHTTSGVVHYAENAVATGLSLCVFPWSWLGALLRLPFVGYVTAPAYTWVAQRRHTFLPALPVPYPPPTIECQVPPAHHEE